MRGLLQCTLRTFAILQVGQFAHFLGWFNSLGGKTYEAIKPNKPYL